VLGELMQLQVQRHDDVCITRVRAPALIDAFPQQLAVWVRSSTYPHNRPERAKIAVLVTVTPTLNVSSQSLRLESKPLLR
jgi:hypothetical protein